MRRERDPSFVGGGAMPLGEEVVDGRAWFADGETARQCLRAPDDLINRAQDDRVARIIDHHFAAVRQPMTLANFRR